MRRTFLSLAVVFGTSYGLYDQARKTRRFCFEFLLLYNNAHRGLSRPQVMVNHVSEEIPRYPAVDYRLVAELESRCMFI